MPVQARSNVRVNQKMIARSAGISQATVSLVLAGKPVTSEQTRRRVLETADRLRYRPNLLVHALQTGKTRTIGVMIPPFDFYWSEVLYGIHDVLAAEDHVPITLWTAHTGEGPRRRTASVIGELEQVHRLLDRRVDGVILWPRFASLYHQHVAEFSSRQLPVVTIDHELPASFRADFVGTDESEGARLVAEHLLALGHRNIGHLAGPAVASWAVARRIAFEQWVRRRSGVSLMTLEAPPGDVAGGIDQARALLRGGERPSAVFAASDLYAKVVYQAAAELGLRIPQDLSVVGYSDDGFAAEMSPPLTTVRQLAYEVGRTAAQLALDRSLGRIKTRTRQRRLLAVEWVDRESTAPPLSQAVRATGEAHTCVSA